MYKMVNVLEALGIIFIASAVYVLFKFPFKNNRVRKITEIRPLVVCALEKNDVNVHKATCEFCKGYCYLSRDFKTRYGKNVSIMCGLCAFKHVDKFSPQSRNAIINYYREVTN